MIPTGAPDFFGASAAADEINGAEPAMEDSLAYGHLLDSLPPEDPVQVAGVGSALGRIFGRSVKGAVKGVLPRGVEALTDTNRVLIQDAMRDMARARTQGAQARRVDLEAQAQGGVPPVPIAEGAPSPRAVTGTSGEFNLERHHPGAPAADYPELIEKAQNDPGQLLRAVRTADEMGDMLDVVGEQLHQAPRTHESIRAEGFDYDAVAKALTQEGLANDRQLFALRTMAATVGERIALVARDIYQGNRNPGNLLEYEKLSQQFIALTSFTKGQTREVARALSQQNMVADTLQGNDLRALMGALNAATGGDPEALVKSASALVEQLDSGVPPDVAFRGALERRTPLEAVIELWKANNLSGFATQGFNMISSPVVMFAEASARLLAVPVGEARKALGVGSSEYYSGREFMESAIGSLNGLRHSLNFFWHTLATGESQMGAYGGKEIGSSAIYDQFTGPNGFLGRFGLDMSPNVSEAIATPAFRVMKSVDDAMMLPATIAELSGLATRDGIERGLTGEALIKHIDGLLMDPPYAMQQEALEQGRKVVMQASAEDPYNAGYFTMMGELLHRGVKSLPMFQFVVPWIKTPARILDYAVESSVLALVQPGIRRALAEGGAKGDIAAGKVMLGMAVTASMWPLIAGGYITGAGPEDFEQRAALERKGWLPYSFKVGNTYVSYRNWADPVIGLIAGIATGLERAQYARLDTDVARHVITAAASSMEYMMEMSYMEGFKRLFDASRGQDKWAAWVGSVLQGFVPYGGALSSTARIIDQTDRARSKTKSPGFSGESYVDDLFNGVKEDFRIRFPFLRDDVRPARYWDGQVKVPEGPEIVKTLLPMNMRGVQVDHASDELIKYGVKISEPRSRFDFGTKYISIELLDLDGGKGMVYDKYIEDVGKARREAVEIMINSYQYKVAPRPEKALMLDYAISQGHLKGDGVFWQETLMPLIEGRAPGLEKSGQEIGMTLEQFAQYLLLQAKPAGVRAIVPQSRREIALPPALEFK